MIKQLTFVAAVLALSTPAFAQVDYRVLATSKTSTMEKGGDYAGKFRYKLLATSRTGTMQKEMSDAAADGYDYIGQTVFESTFGGEEVVSIVERGAQTESDFIYKLIATSKTSTLQKEMTQIGRDGYQALGMTVGKTALGGTELVVIARKRK